MFIEKSGAILRLLKNRESQLSGGFAKNLTMEDVSLLGGSHPVILNALEFYI